MESAAPSPSVTEQLNVDVEAGESRVQIVTTPVDSKIAQGTAMNQAPTPSSPLLTSLLQSPTTSVSNGASKTPSSASKQILSSSKINVLTTYNIIQNFTFRFSIGNVARIEEFGNSSDI